MLNAAQSAPAWTWWHSVMTLLVLVSFPLAAILFFGAWLFHRDLTR
jgi:hypothetical protein